MVASLATITHSRPETRPTPGDDARGMDIAAIEAVRRQRRQFEKRRAGIDQQIDALAGQHLAARGVAGARGFAAAAGDARELVAQLRDQRPHRLGVVGKIGRRGIDTGTKRHDSPARLPGVEILPAVSAQGATALPGKVNLRSALLPGRPG